MSDLLDASASDERRSVARAELLLDRYGVVSREAALAEDVPGGFGPLRQVLQAMEDAGRVRRGWFVEGLSGVQFARPGAVDRLREEPGRAPEVRALAAVDPANPYGGLLSWPGSAGDERPRRVPRARAILVDGRLALWAGPGLSRLVTFPGEVLEGDLELAFRALGDLPRGRGRSPVVRAIDSSDVAGSPHRALLEAAGFVSDYRGFVPDPDPRRRAAP